MNNTNISVSITDLDLSFHSLDNVVFLFHKNRPPFWSHPMLIVTRLTQALMFHAVATCSHRGPIFKIGTIHPHGLNERFLKISFHSFCFCPACADKSGDCSPFHSIVYVHQPPTYSLHASASFTDRL